MYEKEYEDLRKEIIHCHNISNKTSLAMFTATIIILGYFLKDNQLNPCFFLSPIFIIIPCYLLQIDANLCAAKISAYIIAFTTKRDEFKWELRLHIYRELKINNLFLKKKTLLDYLSCDSMQFRFTYFLCFILFYYSDLELSKINFNDINLYSFFDLKDVLNNLNYDIIKLLNLKNIFYIMTLVPFFILKPLNLDEKGFRLVYFWRDIKEFEEKLYINLQTLNKDEISYINKKNFEELTKKVEERFNKKLPDEVPHYLNIYEE